MSYTHDPFDHDLNMGNNNVNLTLRKISQIKLKKNTYAILHIAKSKNVIVIGDTNYEPPNMINYQNGKEYEIDKIQLVETGKTPFTSPFKSSHILLFVFIAVIALLLAFHYGKNWLKSKFLSHTNPSYNYYR